MSRYKVGDKVIVTKSNSYFNKNDVLIVVRNNYFRVVEGKNEGVELFGCDVEVEKFLEPKYKVGDIVRLFPSINNDNEGEIVKCAFNKKKNYYVYLVFDVKDGYPVCQTEEQIKIINSKCPKCGTKI